MIRPYEVQCLGKKAYVSEFVANRGNIYHHGKKSRKVSYKCPHCTAWHLGLPTTNEYLNEEKVFYN